MSRSIVRRLTAAITLVTVLCFAVPAMAAPTRLHSKAPVVFGGGLFDQVLSWLSSFLPGPEPKPQGPATKGITGIGNTDTSSSASEDPDRGAMIDPNGGR
jgi:hypothetical protein